MITTQRLILIVISINLLIGLVYTIYDSPTAFGFNKLNLLNDDLEQYESEFTSDSIQTRGQPSSDQQGEVTAGNTIAWGGLIIRAFLNGVIPISSPRSLETPIEKVFVIILSIFRSLMLIVLIVELYMVFKSSKTS